MSEILTKARARNLFYGGSLFFVDFFWAYLLKGGDACSGQQQMTNRPSWRLLAALSPFGAGAAAVNLFFAALITQTLGWRVLTPYEALA